MNILTANTRAIDTMNLIAKLKLIRRLALIAFCAMPMLATGAEQKTFATPDEAVDALLAALKADDDAALVAIFGDKHKTLVVTPDRAANSANARQSCRRDADVSPSRRNGEGSPRAADRRSGLAVADSAGSASASAGGLRRRKARTRSSTGGSGRTSAARSRFCTRISMRRRTTPRATATATASCSTRSGSAARRASTTDCTGRPMRQRARKRARSDRWSRKARRISRATQAGDPYRGYHFRILTRQGKSARRRRVQLRHQRAHDRRLRDGGVSRPVRRKRRDDLHRQPQRQDLREGSRQEFLGRDRCER